MKRVFDALFTAVALLLFIPTVLILVSWNAIPGDRLYSLKSSLEDGVILIFSGTPFLPKVSMKFTDRRLNEATVLLSKKGSTVGYDLLVAEAKQTQNYIIKKDDAQSSVQFSKNIAGYKKEIEKKKIEVRAEIQAKAAGQPAATNVTNVYTTNIYTTAPTANPYTVPTPIPTGETVSLTVPETDTTQVTGDTAVVVNKPEVVVIKDETPEEQYQTLLNTDAQLDEINTEVTSHKFHNSSGNGNSNGSD